MIKLSELFIERLKKIIPVDKFSLVEDSFKQDNAFIYRINTLKVARQEVLSVFSEKGIKFSEIDWSDDAIQVNDFKQDIELIKNFVSEGKIYKQGLSSILVPLILGVNKDDSVLDLCAAPGSKSTQMSAMMDNNGSIVCIEKVKNRFYRLKSVVTLLGAENISFQLMDGRRYRSNDMLFDKILVDAPCSSEGRFSLQKSESLRYWSLRKIKEMQKKQKGLLMSASRLLKPSGVLVYSTCTFAPEENEGVIDWFLKKTNNEFEIDEIVLKGIDTYPCVDEWKGKVFNKQVKKCVRILPGNKMQGFFMAKIKKYL